MNWYTAAPTVPMSYLIVARWSLLRLKERKVDQGGMSLKAFNDWALSFGTLPWRWMEQSGPGPSPQRGVAAIDQSIAATKPTSFTCSKPTLPD